MRSVEQIQNVAVIGTGTMGPGIAQIFAQGGLKVVLYDIKKDQLEKASKAIQNNLNIFQEVGFLTSKEADEVRKRIISTSSLEEATQKADFVLEAVPEVLDIKKSVFQALEGLCPPDVILATNTSGISITEIAKATRTSSRVVGMHWWNPPIIIPAIEIIKGERTEEEFLVITKSLVTKIKKIPVIVRKDVPGFLGNRMQYALMREAIALLNEGVASAEDIDMMIKAGIGFKFPVMGPLETIDMAGLDIFYRVSQYLYGKLDQSSLPPATVKEKVEKNELGLKTGKGFYDYTHVDTQALMAERIKKLMVILREIKI
jgi:3-hydroxybutyryl-CoA dehydrogenase